MVINCIPGPHYLGNSGDLAGTYPGIYRILCPRRPGTYPGLMRGDISVKKARNLLLRDVHICQDSDQRCPGLWGGDLPGDLQEKCPPQSRAVPEAVPWISQSTKLNPLASPRYPQEVGGEAGVTIDSGIAATIDSCIIANNCTLRDVLVANPTMYFFTFDIFCVLEVIKQDGPIFTLF